MITHLKENQIFVFGSNEGGRHGKGAALTATVYGVGEGLTGKCYALPTKDKHLNVLPLDQIAIRIRRFLNVARKNSHLEFLVTPVGTGLAGTGLAGYSYREIAILFGDDIPPNVKMPKEFFLED